MKTAIKKVVNKVADFLRKKSFWLPDSIAALVEAEAKRKIDGEKKWRSESALVTHIISQWFK